MPDFVYINLYILFMTSIIELSLDTRLPLKAIFPMECKDGYINRDILLKDKLFFSKVQYFQTIEDPKQKTHDQNTLHRSNCQKKKEAILQKSNTRRICNTEKGRCRHRKKFSSTHDIKGKHIHRSTKHQKPHAGAVAITSCVDLTTDSGNLQLGIHGTNTSADVFKTSIRSRSNVNQGIDVAPSITNVGLAPNNGGARFSSAHVLQTKIVARRTPFVKPNVVNNITSTEGNRTLTTDTFKTHRDEVSVGADLENQDAGISLDTALEIECSTSEQDTQREDCDNQVPVSAGLIKDSLDPVLTVCNLPPVLITSNINLGSNSACSTPQYKRNMPSTQIHTSKREMHEQKTEMLPRHLYLEHLPSRNKAEVVAQSAPSVAISADLRNIQHDTRSESGPMSAAIIPKNSMDSVLTVCNLPTLLITSSMDKMPHIENSKQQYSEIVPCPQAQGPQAKSHELNIKVLPHDVQYLQQVGASQPVTTTNLGHQTDLECSTTEYFQNIPSHQFQVPASKMQELKKDVSPQKTQYLNPHKSVPRTVTSLEFNTKTACSTSKYNRNMMAIKGHNSKRHKNVNSEFKKKYKCESDHSAKSSICTGNLERTKNIECSTSHYKRKISLGAKISQNVKRDLESKLLLHGKQFPKPNISIADSITTDIMGLKKKTERSRSEHNKDKQCLEKISAKRDQTLDHKSDYSPRRKHLKSDTVGALTSATVNIDLKYQDEGSKPKCNLSMPSLEHDKGMQRLHNLADKRDQTLDRKADHSPRRKHLKPDTVGALTSTSINIDLKYEDEGCKPKCNLSMPSLEADATIELPVETKPAQSCDTQYLKTQKTVSSTILMTSDEIPINAPKVQRRRRTKSKKEFPILAIIEGDMFDPELPNCSLDTVSNVVATSQENKQPKELAVSASAPSVSEQSVVSSSVDLVNKVERSLVESEKQCLKTETSVLLSPPPKAVCDNLDDISRDGTVVETKNQCSKKATMDLSIPTAEVVGDHFDGIYKEVQRDEVENEKGCLDKDIAVLSIPIVEAVVDNLDDIPNRAEKTEIENEKDFPKNDTFDSISIEVQTSVVDNQNQYPKKDASTISIPTVEAVDDNLDNMSNDVQRSEVENEKQCLKRDTSTLSVTTAEDVDDNLCVISNEVQRSVVESEKLCPKKDTSILSIPIAKDVGDNLDDISNDENISVEGSTSTNNTQCDVPGSVDLINRGANPMPSDSDLQNSTTTEDPVSDTENNTPQCDTKSQQLLVTQCEGQAIKMDSPLRDAHEIGNNLEETTATVDDTKIAATIESTPTSPQPGTSQEDTPSLINPSDTSETVISLSSISTNNKDKLSENNAEPSDEQGEPKAASNLKCQFFRSARGKRMLSVDGIRYRVNNISADKIRWRCSSHERFGCKAKLHTIGNKIVYFVNEHVTFSLDDNVDDLEPFGIIDEEN